MSRRRGYISTTVDVDISDILDEISDDDILDEVAARKLSLGGGEPTDMDLVREAYEELARGRAAEARSILDRLLYPKWQSKSACEAAFNFPKH